LSPQETDVVPDTRLLDKFSQLTPQLLTGLDGTAQSSPLETLYIMDFFIALAICNTVVVSAPNQPRQKVNLNEGFPCQGKYGVYRHLSVLGL
jgi:phospholipid-translocating ATPase